MNEPKLMDTIVNLPDDEDFLSAVLTIYTHPKFKFLEENISIFVKNLPKFMEAIGENFDIDKLWSGNKKFENKD